MKKNKLKIITIILLILLTTMVAFFGVYGKVQNRMENGVKDYSYAMDLKGARVVTFKVDDSTKKTIKDAEGKVIENATEDEIKEKGYTTEEKRINGEEKLTFDNYKLSKTIIENRLRKLYVKDFEVRVNEDNGEMVVTLPEDDRTDDLINNIMTVGKFEIVDTETKEVLLSNEQIKVCEALRRTTASGVAIYFSIEFNDEGKKKLEDITNTYVKVKEETTTAENNTEENKAEDSKKEKTITMKIDDEDIMSTSFDETIKDGKIYLTVGQTTTDTDTLSTNLDQARNMSAILSNKVLPLSYKQVGNIYIASADKDNITTIMVVTIAIMILLTFVVFAVKFKLKGMLATCSAIGAISLLLLIVRYTNVVLSTEGVIGIFAILILNIIMLKKILVGLKETKENKKVEPKQIINKAIKDITLKVIPLFIMSIMFAYVAWIRTSSFGMVMFYGLTIIVLYNLLITKNLLNYEDKK